MAESSRLKAKGERRKAESKKLKAERVKKKLNPQPSTTQLSTLNSQPLNTTKILPPIPIFTIYKRESIFKD